MECRSGCAACCIAPSISSAIPGMPDGKPAGIESMGTAECNMLASYTRGTVSFSVHGEKPVMVSVRLDELMRLLQAAAAVCHHEQEDKKNAEEEKA